MDICDHIFIFSDLKLSTAYQRKIIFNENDIVKIWFPTQVRKYCELCEENFGAAAMTFEINQTT